MKVSILKHLQAIACIAYKANDYCNREQEKRQKRKIITRVDFIFVGFLIILVAVLLSLPKSTAPSSTLSAYKGDTNSIALTEGKGRGGVTSTTAGCPGQTVAGPCLAQPTSVTTQQPVSPPVPVDPVGVINNWNGQPLAGSTFVGGQGQDWMVQNQAGNAVSGAAFQTDPNLTVDQKNLQGIWQQMIAVVGAFLVIMFILIGYKIMGGAVGFRYANAIEDIPRVFLAGLAAFLSIIFVSFIIGLENGLCQEVIHKTLGMNPSLKYTDIVIPANAWLNNIGQFFLGIIAIIVGAFLTALPGIGLFFGAAAVAIASNQIINYGQAFILTLLSLTFAIQLIARLAMIDIYIVLSPLAIGCWALPNQLGQNVTRQWASGFLSLVFIQFAQVICLSVGLLLFKKPGPDAVGDLFNFVGPIAILWLTLRIPHMFGSSAVGTVTSAGQTVSGAAAAIATAAAAI